MIIGYVFSHKNLNSKKCKMEVRKTQLKAYMISWYGPFHSIEEVKEWEKSNSSSNLYLLQGKRKSAKLFSYYCGQTKRDATTRFKDKYHCIRQMPNQLNIWIGTFTHRFKTEDINVVENLLIHLLSLGINEMQLLNERNLYFQSQNSVFLQNQWHNPNFHKQPDDTIKLALPEMTVYDATNNALKISKRLRPID